MSGLVSVAPESASTTPSATETVRQSARRGAFWVVAGVGALIVVVILLLVQGAGVASGDPFRADGSGPTGSMAVVEVLKEQGVDVRVAHGLDEALTDSAGDTTLFVSDPHGYLDTDQLDRLQGAAKNLVVALPDFTMLSVLAPGVSSGGVPRAESAAARCDVPAAVRAGSISTGDTTLSAAPTWTTCFPSGESYSLLQRTADGSTTTLLADGAVLQNSTITQRGNAALALGLLGERPALVWYLPSIADVPAGPQPTITDLTPTWVTPVLLLLAVVFIAAAIWRGRRFGALVVENLPVVVPASETMEGRARLYARTASRVRAADALRIGTIDRIARRSGLSASASVDEVIGVITAITGKPGAVIRDLLVDSEPRTDRDLVELSDRLRDLEDEVHTAAGITPNQPRTERVDE